MPTVIWPSSGRSVVVGTATSEVAAAETPSNYGQIITFILRPGPFNIDNIYPSAMPLIQHVISWSSSDSTIIE